MVLIDGMTNEEFRRTQYRSTNTISGQSRAIPTTPATQKLTDDVTDSADRALVLRAKDAAMRLAGRRMDERAADSIYLLGLVRSPSCFVLFAGYLPVPTLARD